MTGESQGTVRAREPRAPQRAAAVPSQPSRAALPTAPTPRSCVAGLASAVSTAACTDEPLAPAPGEMGALVDELRSLVLALGGGRRLADDAGFDRQAFAQASGFAPARAHAPFVVVGADVAIELGAPTTASASAVLVTSDRARVHPGRVTLLGPDLDALGSGRHSFAQLVIVHARDPERPPDPFLLDRAQYLIHRLPGYMVRSVPGRLWVRVSRKALARGLCLRWVGQALACALGDELEEVAAVEVVFLTAEAATDARLARWVAECAVLTGRHKKLSLGVDGTLECADLDCERCDDRPVCDALREVVASRRRRSP